MGKPLRIGIVGCGRILPAHLQGYKALLDHGADDFEITAICARKVEDAQRFIAPGLVPPRGPVSENEHDPLNAPHLYLDRLFPDTTVSVWTDAAAMIAEADIDVVDVTASVAAHHTVTLDAVRHGKHVMVQKPMAISVAAAKHMVAAADAAGVVLAVMEDVHYQPSVLMAYCLVNRGYLGRIQMVLATYLGTHQWSPDKIVADTPWRHRVEQAGGGISIDLGVHFFQHLRRVCGPISSVYGTVRTFERRRYTRDASGAVIVDVEANVDDTMFCQVEFGDGGIGHVSASWAGHGVPTELPGGMVIYGEKGCLQGDQFYLNGSPPVSLAAWFEQHATERDRDTLFPLAIRHPFAQSYLDFFSAIRGGHHPSYDGVQGLTDLAWSVAVLRSSQEHRPFTAQDIIDQAASDAASG